jgi:hypothetical protein
VTQTRIPIFHQLLRQQQAAYCCRLHDRTDSHSTVSILLYGNLPPPLMEDILEGGLTRQDVRFLYLAVTRIIRTSGRGTGVSMHWLDLQKALTMLPRAASDTPRLLHTFTSWQSQAQFVFNAEAGRRPGLVAAIRDILSLDGLRPIQVVREIVRIDITGSLPSHNVSYEDGILARHYCVSASRFRDNALWALHEEEMEMKAAYDKVHLALRTHQGDPIFYITDYGTNSMSSPKCCMIAGLGKSAANALPLNTELSVGGCVSIDASAVNTRARIRVLTVVYKEVDRRGVLHCVLRRNDKHLVASSMHGMHVVIKLLPYDDSEARLKGALNSLVWRRQIHTCELARAVVGVPALCDVWGDDVQNCGTNGTRNVFDVTTGAQAMNEIHEGARQGVGLSILTGGPGSGKTLLAASFAVQYVTSRSNFEPPRRILFVAPSNAAVNAGYLALRSVSRERGYDENFVTLVRASCRKEKNQLPTDEHDVRYSILLRHIELWHRRRESSLLSRFELQDLEELRHGVTPPGTGKIWAGLVHLFVREAAEKVAASAIVCCTTDMIVSRAITHEAGDFTFVIADEAGQASKAQLAAVATVPGVSSGLLVGDEMQLGPFGSHRMRVASPFSELVLRARNEGIGRLVSVSNVYRCHPFIVNVFNTLFYGGKLTCGVADEDRPLDFGLSRLFDAKKPVTWLDIDAAEARVGSSFQSLGEVAAIEQVLFEMQQNEIDLTTVCVLAPYARQVDLLDISTCALYPRTAVQTIDSSQGSTFEYTILSLVRCNEKCDLGFVGDSRRLNVMLSRARRGVLIVGSHRTALGVGRCDGSNLDLRRLARMCSYAGVVKPHLQAVL